MGQHISTQLKSIALQNIKTKHKIIKKWIESGVPWVISANGGQLRDSKGELILDWYPTSLRKYCAWDGKQNCSFTQGMIPEIKTTGFETLNKHQKLKSKIEADINALKQKADVQLLSTNKSNLIRALKDELKLETLKRKSTQISYQQAREEVVEASRKLETERRTQIQTTEYLKSEIARKDKQIATLNQRVADLTASLDKIAPIRRIKY